MENIDKSEEKKQIPDNESDSDDTNTDDNTDTNADTNTDDNTDTNTDDNTDTNDDANDNTNNESSEYAIPPILPEIALPFTYIESGNYSKSLSLYDGINPVIIKICAYSINTNCIIEGLPNTNPNITNTNFTLNKQTPFLQFVFDKNTFPSFQYQIPAIKDSNTEIETDKSSIDVHFETECFKHLFEYFTCDEPIINEYKTCNNPDINKNAILEHYKGYIQHGESLIVLFDITNWIHVLKPDYTIAIVNEIIHKKKINNTEIDADIIDFFQTNDELTELHNTDGSLIPYPFQLYLCELKDDKIEGTVADFQSMQKTDKKVGFLKPVFHSKLGYSYYFNNILEYDESQLENLQRFAVFVVNGLYILEDINEYDLNNEANITDFTEASTIYLHENGIQLWSIHNLSHYTMM